MLLLNVPYAKKDEAKTLGARWIPEYKKWAAMSPKEYPKFYKWIDANTIVLDHVYIITGEIECFRCHKKTTVVALGVDAFLSIERDWFSDAKFFINKSGIHFCPYPTDIMPKELSEYLSKKYMLFFDYSKFIKKHYMANHCIYCGVLQGNFFLFHDIKSPFCFSNEEDIKEIKVYKYKLPYDLACDLNIEKGAFDDKIQDYVKIQDLIINNGG